MGNNQDGLVAVRDYPDGSPMLLTLEERLRLIPEQTRPRRRRRLIDDTTETDSDGSQGDRPSHASVSQPDVSPDPAYILTLQHTGSATNTPPNTPRRIRSNAREVNGPPPTRSIPSTTPPTANTRLEAPIPNNAG
jgi:hypothetical protein